MSNYIFKLTDSTKNSIIVKPFSTNGSLTPTSILPLQPTAVSSSTSLVLVGQGLLHYGDVVQSNLLYLLENFANGTPPINPIEGQLWFNNSSTELSLFYNTTWNRLVVSGMSVQEVDLNAQRLTNVALPVQPADATTKQYVDDGFVNVSGDTMVGNLTLIASPVVDQHATNKLYVDSTVNSAVLAADGSTIAYVDAQDALKVSKSGDSMTGDLSMNSADVFINGGTLHIIDGSVVFGGTVSVLDMNNVRIDNVGTPTGYLQATNKAYVDTSISSVSIDDATLDTGGVLTLHTSNGSTIPLPSASLASFSHTHVSSEVTHPLIGLKDVRTFYIDRYINANVAIPPSELLYVLLNDIGGQIGELIDRTNRIVMLGNNTTTLTLPFKYPVNDDKLSVFRNGIKLYRNDRAEAIVSQATPFKMFDSTPLSNVPYAYNITVDGTLHSNISVDFSSYSLPIRYVDLIPALDRSLETSAYVDIIHSGAITANGATGLNAATTYDIVLTIDGKTHSIYTDGTAVPTYAELISLISSETTGQAFATIVGSALRISTASNGVDATITVSSGFAANLFTSLATYLSTGAPVAGTTVAVVQHRDGTIAVQSPTTGTPSQITISAPSVGTDLFATLGSTIVNQASASTYDYSETGTPQRYSNTIAFASTTSTADKYEIIVQPYGLTRTAGGIYL